MKHTISQDELFKKIEWILYIGFSIVAGVFASGVLEQFFSQKTSFAQLEETVNTYPVVTIAPLFRQASKTNLTNVIINYWSEGMASDMVKGKVSMQKLEIGENLLHNEIYNTTEKVILESLEDSYGFRVFRIIHTTPILAKKLSRVMIEMHTNLENNSIMFSDVVMCYLTSLTNSPGFFDVPGTWNDGKPLNIVMDKNTLVSYSIQPQKTKYLQQMGKCQEESYYECISYQIDGTEFNDCSKKCIPNVFSNMGRNYSTAFCQNDTSNQQCIIEQILKKDLESKCKKSCSMLEYYGHFEINMPFRGYESEYENWNAYFLLYKLKNNNFAAKVYEEYLIYDAIAGIGSVGGTLGMLI